MRWLWVVVIAARVAAVWGSAVSVCVLYALETSENTDKSFALSELPFRDCSGEVTPDSVSIKNCANTDSSLTFAASSSGPGALIDGDKTTGYECQVDGSFDPVVGSDDPDAVPAVFAYFNTAIELNGYDIITGLHSTSATDENGHLLNFKVDCYADAATIEADDPSYSETSHASTPFAEVVDGIAAETKYTEVSTIFDGIFPATCLTAGGDPFVSMSTGGRRQFWLPHDTWTQVLQGPTHTLWAHAFGKPGTTEQWLDGLRISRTTTSSSFNNNGEQNDARAVVAPVLSVVLPSDADLGAVPRESADADLDFVQVAFDGLPLEHVTRGNAELVSTDGALAVRVAKLDDKRILDKAADSLWIRGPDFSFHVFTSHAQKFDSTAQNDLFTHLQFKFLDLPDRPDFLKGFFYEAVYLPDDLLSPQTKALLTKPDKPYTASQL